jgi:hypothetical protein
MARGRGGGVAAVSEAVARLRAATEGLIDAGRGEGIEPGGPLGQWLEAQAEALQALAAILDGQEARIAEVMRSVSATSQAELQKLSAATELGTKVVRAGEYAVREAHVAQIVLATEKETLVSRMMTETLPMFAEKLKGALIIREKALNDDVKRRHWLGAILVGFGLSGFGYGMHVWHAWEATTAYEWCGEHLVASGARVYCEMTGVVAAPQRGEGSGN